MKPIKKRKIATIEPEEKWIRTEEMWYGTYQPHQYNNPLPYCAVKVRMSLLTDGNWRVSVWGNDDFGLELDQPERQVAKKLFVKIKDFTTQRDLKDMGFIPC